MLSSILYPLSSMIVHLHPLSQWQCISCSPASTSREAALAGPVPYLGPVLADLCPLRASRDTPARANRDRQLQRHLTAVMSHIIPRVAGDDPTPIAAHMAGGDLRARRAWRQLPALGQRQR